MYVYTIVSEPILLMEGQNWFPLTPFPVNTPLSGEALRVTQSSYSQRLPICVIAGTTLKTVKSKETGRLRHPLGFIEITSIAPGINPEVVELQSISTDGGVGFDIIDPTEIQTYDQPGPRSGTENISEADPKQIVSEPEIGPTVGTGGFVNVTDPFTVHPFASVIKKL